MPRPLGQHFLRRTALLEKIAQAACPTREPVVVEIGAGEGALTERLLQRADRVVAIEVDARLVEVLRRRFSAHPGLEIVPQDVLEVDLARWGPAVVAGNLPYYISSPILERIAELGPALKRAVLLLQQEVAERVVARPGSRRYGLLSVRVQSAAEAEILFRVPARAFSPPPKVESAAVRLTPRAEPLMTPAERAAFLEFAARCFRRKRKTIRNNLAGFCSAELLAQIPCARLRAEQLSLPELWALYRRLKTET